MSKFDNDSSTSPCVSVFLTVVVVSRNDYRQVSACASLLSEVLGGLVEDYELIIVDNASTDDSLERLRADLRDGTIANAHVCGLAKEVAVDVAAWAGLENALGDFVLVLDPVKDDVRQIGVMLRGAVAGADVVYARNLWREPVGMGYRIFSAVFIAFYRWLSGIDLDREVPRFRMMSRQLLNFILRHPNPLVAYRLLPVTGGFNRVSLEYSHEYSNWRRRNLRDSVDLGMRLLVSTTHAPMRLVTALSLFGAVANFFYSGYVIGVALLKPDVAPGWVTLSLQQSGMFLLLSLVLLVLGEYILQMVRLGTEGAPYHVVADFSSSVVSRHRRLNVVDSQVRREEGK